MKLSDETFKARRYAGNLPGGVFSALHYHKGNSSSTNSQSASNQQVAVSGSGSATGAVTASGAKSTAVSGGSSLNQNSVKAGANSSVTINNTSLDPEVAAGAFQVANNALLANTEVNEDATDNFELANENIATLASQVVSSFGPRATTDAGTLATSPATAETTDATINNDTDYILVGSAIVGLILTAVVFFKSKGTSA